MKLNSGPKNIPLGYKIVRTGLNTRKMPHRRGLSLQRSLKRSQNNFAIAGSIYRAATAVTPTIERILSLDGWNSWRRRCRQIAKKPRHSHDPTVNIKSS